MRFAVQFGLGSAVVLVGATIASCAAFGEKAAPSSGEEAGVSADAGTQDTGSPDAELRDGLDAGPVPCGSRTCAADSECIQGQCAETFATAQDAIGIALMGGDVYFTEQGGALFRKAKTDTDRGAASEVPLPNATKGGWQYLTRYQTTLSWTRWADGAPSVSSVTFGGAPAQVVNEPAFIAQATGIVRTDDGRIYVTSYGAGDVYTFDNDRNATRLWHVDGQAEGLTTDGTTVFVAWFSAGKIATVPSLVSSGLETIDVGGQPAGLALAGSTFFFTDQSNGTVASVPRKGGARSDLARVPNTTAIGIAVDDSHVYWVTSKSILRIHR